MVATGDSEGRITSINETGARLTGHAPEELVGQPFSKIVAREHLAFVADQVRRRASGESPTAVYEVEVMTKDGTRVPIEISATAIYENGEHVGQIAIARDLRDRRAIEEQLRQAQKMEAVGRVARGIAHDFNNVLLVMRGFGELIMGKVDEDHPAHRHAQRIVTEAERATQMTRRLLTFSRPDTLDAAPLDLEKCVASMNESLRVLAGDGVELAWRPADGDGTRVLADRGALQQIVLNLVANARDAMPDGGTVTIETRSMSLGVLEAEALLALRPGRYRLLRVSDTGAGMDDETRERVFDPFFTTKDTGSGLGLAIVYGLVQQLHGHVHVESRPGEGTTVTVYLPEAP